jgi:hypothetical protein
MRAVFLVVAALSDNPQSKASKQASKAGEQSGQHVY